MVYSDARVVFKHLRCFLVLLAFAGLASGHPVSLTESSEYLDRQFVTSTGTWERQTTTSFPLKREEGCFITAENGLMYHIGGRGFKRIAAYNPSEKRWYRRDSPIVDGEDIEMNHFSCVAYDDKIWLIGAWYGDYPTEQNHEKIFVYDTASDTWTSRDFLPDNPERRRGAAALVVHNDMFYLSHGTSGGHGAPQATSFGYLDVYDPSTDTWNPSGTLLPDAPNPRGHTGGGIVEGKFCVASGRNDGAQEFFQATVQETDCYDFASNEWSVHGMIPGGRAGAGVGVDCDGNLVVAGGEGFGQAHTSMFFFKISTGWSTGTSLVSPRHASGMAIGDCTCKHLYLAAGSETEGGSNKVQTTDRYTPNSAPPECQGTTQPPTTLPVVTTLPAVTGAPSTGPPPPGTWVRQTTTSFPLKREEGCFITAENGLMYHIGGRGFKRIAAYNPSEKRWYRRDSPIVDGEDIEMNHFSCVAYDDKIWLIGAWYGDYPTEQNHEKIFVYDTASDTWTSRDFLPDNPERRRGAAALVVHNDMFYLSHGTSGGHGAPQATSFGYLDVYDPSTDTWNPSGTLLPDAPNPRGHTGGGIVEGKFCVASGRNDGAQEFFQATVQETDCYDFASNEWSVHGMIPGGRAGAGVGVDCDGNLVVAGGEGFGQAHTSMFFFKISTGWSTGTSLVSPRHASGMAIGDCTCKHLYLAAGSETEGGSNKVQTTDRYTPETAPAQCQDAIPPTTFPPTTIPPTTTPQAPTTVFVSTAAPTTSEAILEPTTEPCI